MPRRESGTVSKTSSADGSASVPIDREFLRSGLLARLTNAETNTYLQVLWNGPITAAEVFGVSYASAKRSMGRLSRVGLVTRTSAGYVSATDFRECGNYVWVEPLRYGWLSLPARLLLIFLSEWCDGRIHSYHRGMAEAMEAILGIKRRQYDALFGELLAQGMVRKLWGEFDSVAYAPLEARQSQRARPGYIRGRHTQALSREPTGEQGSPAAYAGAQGLRKEGSGTAFGGLTSCVQGSSSGSSLRAFSWAHSPAEEGERGNTEAEQSASTSANSDAQAHTPSKATASGAGLTSGEGSSSEASEASTAPAERDPSKATPARTGDALKPLPPSKDSAISREAYFLRVFMETKDIERKYLRGVENSARAHGLKATLDGLTPSQWIWCLDGLRRNTTASFKVFFEGGEHEALARQAIALTEQRVGHDFIHLREVLGEAIRENADAPGAADAQAVLADFDFEISRPMPYHVGEWVKGAMLRPIEWVCPLGTRKDVALFVADWKPRSKDDILAYGRKYRHDALVERLVAQYEAIVNAPGYQERVEAQLQQRAEIERENEALARQRAAEREEQVRRMSEARTATIVPPPPREYPPEIRQRAAELRARLEAAKRAI